MASRDSVTVSMAALTIGMLMAIRRVRCVRASVSDGSSLGVVADSRCDVGAVGYQMQLLVQRVGAALSPALVAELKESVLQ